MCDETKEYLEYGGHQFMKTFGIWYDEDGERIRTNALINELERKFLETYKST